MKAILNGVVLADSTNIEEIDGISYFPVSSIDKDLFIESTTRSYCPYKGYANYFHIKVDGQIVEDAAWYYKKPSDMAYFLKDRIAFWKGVEIEENDKKVKRELLSMLSYFI